MERPYIILHMVQSVDGKVTGEFLSSPVCEKATAIYYDVNRRLRPDAFACGSITMEESFTGGYLPDLSSFDDGVELACEDYIADKKARFFALSFDRRGRLGWKTACIEDEDPGYGGAHIIEVLSQPLVDKRYLAYLRSIGVSYVFAGEEGFDLPLALHKLKTLFGINKLLLEGGSILNGAFLREELVDEMSLVVAPVVARAEDKPLFNGAVLKNFTLTEATTQDGMVILNYRKA